MTVPDLERLAVLVERKRAALLSRWREAVRQLPSAKHLDTPTLNDHIPALLDKLVAAFRSVRDETIAGALAQGSPPVHGHQRFKDGFDIVEVVTEYNILRGCFHTLAEAEGAGLHGEAFHIVNRVFDDAIGLAVQTFATQQALEVQRRREEHLAFVGHDLRTPLNAISIAARILEHKLSERENGAGTGRVMDTLQRNVNHLEELVGNILKESADVSAEGGVELERRRFDLWPIVEDLIHDLEPVAGTAGTRLVNEIPHDLRAYADAGLLRRIFQNLLANAIKFTPRGEVRIGARAIGTDGNVECWISDNGAGIARDRLATIFEKSEADVDREGRKGMGLSIVKRFVEAHGGEVTAESEEGTGSTFTFTLPGTSGAAGDRSV